MLVEDTQRLRGVTHQILDGAESLNREYWIFPPLVLQEQKRIESEVSQVLEKKVGNNEFIRDWYRTH